MGLVVWPMMARGLAGQDHPQIVVWVYNDAGVDGATILAAEKIAAQIYEPGGFEIVWNNCPSAPQAEPKECSQALPPGRIFLHIEHQPRTLHDRPRISFGGGDLWLERPRAVHALERHDVSTGIHDRDRDRFVECDRMLFGRLENAFGIG